ncbi:MAG: GAF domain-containing protein [Actinobacteria bacterium]|nr:GAF domain-containing protein [Actinomycetota bacterium]
MGKSLEHLLIPYRLRVVRIGVLATWLTVASLIAFERLAHRETIEPAPFFLLIAAAAVGAAVVSTLPWQRLFESGVGVWVLYAWSALDILLITLLIAYSGGSDSEIFILFFLTTVFFSASYPEGGQIGLSVFTLGCYLGVLAATGWEVSWGEVIIRLGILAVMGFIASFVSRELIEQMVAREEARAESERRAELLQRVATAAREVSALGPDEVLSNVVDAAVDLGFDAVAILVLDDEQTTFTPTHARGLPVDFTERTFPVTEGLVGLVLENSGTVAVSDYASLDAPVPVIKTAGITAATSTPLWVGSEIKAVLSAGKRGDRSLASEEVEAVELLAGMASRALENAELYEEEHRTVQRLSEVDRLKDEFLSMVSHDLRTPLTVIEGSATTLDVNWDRVDEGTRTKLLSVIGSNAKKLGDIITKLLDLTRMEAGHFEIREEPLEIGQILIDVSSRLDTLLAERDFVIEVEQPLVVEADPTLIGRVVENLLSNAAKYTAAGTKIELLAHAVGGECVVSVRDEGAGIPREDLEHLGERFFRGRAASGPVRGTGLGIAWVIQILRLHGSDLRVTSTVGEGSTFEFSLPLAHVVEETRI